MSLMPSISKGLWLVYIVSVCTLSACVDYYWNFKKADIKFQGVIHTLIALLTIYALLPVNVAK